MPRLGIITPSSNVNVEATTAAMLAGVPGVTAHYTRFALPPSRDVPIDAERLAPAAILLAEADVDVLVFHGTSGSRTGLDGDRAMCRELERVTGIPATTASLAIVEALETLDARKLAMVIPGPEWVARAIAEEYSRAGYQFQHFAWTDRFEANIEIGRLSTAEVEAFVRQGIVDAVDAVTVIGTNLAAAGLVDALERRYGTTIVDSTAATTWHLLRRVGVTPRIEGWGRLLQLAG